MLKAFRRVVTATKRHFLEVKDKSELSGAQLWALTQIGNAPGTTVQELAASMSVHQSTTSNLVEKLTSGRLVRKKRDSADRRVVRLFATPAGARLLRKTPLSARGTLPEAISSMSDADLKALEDLLLMLADKLGAPRDAGSTPGAINRPNRN